MLQSRSDAFDLLKTLGAPERLLRHAQLVSHAADALISEFQALGVEFNVRVVELGAILHDFGKIQHPSELSESGSLHEQAGEAMLLAHGLQPEIARCCASHGAWHLPNKLWKGNSANPISS